MLDFASGVLSICQFLRLRLSFSPNSRATADPLKPVKRITSRTSAQVGDSHSLAVFSVAGFNLFLTESTDETRLYLLESVEEGETIRLNAGRYEFWLYRQIRKRFLSGEIYLNDSLRHRHLSDELVAEGEQSAILAEMKIPFLQKSIKTQLKALSGELHRQWKAFNRELKQGKLKHLEYDTETQKLNWHKSVVSRYKEQNQRFYGQLPFCDVTDDSTK